MTSIHPGRGMRSTRLPPIVLGSGSSDPVLADLTRLTSRQVGGIAGPLLPAVEDGRANARTLVLLRPFGHELDRRETFTA